MRSALQMFTFLCSAALAAPASAPQAPQWRLVEEWRVGGDVEGAHAFLDIRDLDILPNGNIVVAEAKTQQIFLLNARGGLIRTIGRSGGGPGEFEQLAGVAVASDGHFVARDPGNGRFSVFSAAGDLISTVPISVPVIGLRWPGFFDDAGRLVETVNIRSTEKRIGGSDKQPLLSVRATYQRWNVALTKSDTIPLTSCVAPSNPEDEILLFQGARQAVRVIPYRPFNRSAVTLDGFQWVSAGDDVILRTPLGSCDAQARVKLAGPRLDVPAAIREAEVDTVRAIAQRVKAPMPDVNKIPGQYPWYQSYFTDSQNRLWVERNAQNQRRAFEIYAPSGALLGAVNSPAGLDTSKPFAFTADHLYAFVTDEDGVQFLVSYKITK